MTNVKKKKKEDACIAGQNTKIVEIPVVKNAPEKHQNKKITRQQPSDVSERLVPGKK